MKKLLFSAIALVAFSSVSMGNTINSAVEIQEVLEPNLEIVFSRWPPSIIKLFSECNTVYNEVLAAYTPVVGTSQATAIAQGAFTGCLGGI